MTLDETVARMMAKYPEMFGQRWQALRFLFCANSYQWKNGQLVHEDDPRVDYFPVDPEMQRRRIEEARTAEIGFHPRDVMCELPADIQSDWMAGAMELMALMDDHYYSRESIIERIVFEQHTARCYVRTLSTGRVVVNRGFRGQYEFFDRDGDAVMPWNITREEYQEAVSLFARDED